MLFLFVDENGEAKQQTLPPSDEQLRQVAEGTLMIYSVEGAAADARLSFRCAEVSIEEVEDEEDSEYTEEEVNVEWISVESQ